MSTDAQNDLAEGLAALDSELGESFVLAASAHTFLARREEREVALPGYGGAIRETVLHVLRANLPTTLPAVGALVTTPAGLTARLARVTPGALSGMMVIALADEFS